MRVVTTVSALYMCASPSSSVLRIHRHGSVGSASVLPFATLWVCNHIWMLYGYVTDNTFPVLTTYAIGDALSVVFLAVYIRWTTERKAVFKTCCIALVCNIAVTVYVMLGKSGLLPGLQQSMTMIVGIIAIASSLALYASPLAAIKLVLQTRSSASLPFAMILAGTINNLLWVVYGALVFDLFLIVPSSVNGALGLVQVALYGVYHPSRGAAGGVIVPVEPCISPKDELPHCNYSVMEPATPLPVTIVIGNLEMCSITIEEPRVAEEER
ncbi:Bidirectional sugar transporter SWEET7 [Phytophthora cinnamomi]|uniref:Bidirectional sugar transporter SWEET7 n=1 Tax=Phytophthora cinnamomi TaxID=4785 RepID=UPI003559ED73|nr:Bidirectional sugar transporter SWEET7 [Phytophthora cinnamomi]